MFGIALGTVLSALPAKPAQPRPIPPVQFELGFGLGFDYGLLGLQFNLRVHRFELFTGVGGGTLFGTLVGGVRYVADSAPGWTFIAALEGGSLWIHSGRSNEFGADESVFVVGTSFGARWNWPSGWFGQVGIGPALYIDQCRDAQRCDFGTQLKPGGTWGGGFGYAF